MKTRNEKMKVSVLALAVQSALAVMFALPLATHAADVADDETAALMRPTNSIEIGGGYVSEDSAKFGEYNGLDESGANLVGNFDIRGGNAYDGGDGTMRWRVSGSDLGTTSRSLGGAVSNQGQWNLNIGHDELRHNITDTYQTPQQGSMGGNNFTLPDNFGTINGAASPSTRVLTATQLGAFHTEKIGTTRKNTSFGAGYRFSPRLSLEFDYNHLDQSGAKLIGTGAQGAIPLVGTGAASALFGFHEANNIIMNPTSYKTDSFNLALNWAGEKGHLTAGYYGSIFRDDYNSLTWQSALANGPVTCVGAGCFVTNTMSTAPDNSLHQLNLTGGYTFSPTTKLAGGFSYGRNTQNDSYASALMQPGGVPQSSLNGLVKTTHADLKLTNQTSNKLVLSAGMKYNERDNRTTSSAYDYYNIGRTNVAGIPTLTPYAGVNMPYSNKKTQVELTADYRLAKGHNLRLAYEREDIKRWCNSVADGAQCLASPSSDEDKLGLTYRLKAREDISFNAGYIFSRRNADFNNVFAANTGSYPVINADDRLGYVAYPYATRKQDLIKAGVNWQVTEKLDLALNGRYANDDYDATLGVQDGRTVSANLDATYSYNENGSVSAYASWQNGERNLRNGLDGSPTVAPTKIWTNQLKDDSNAIGLTTRHRGLMGGKLEIIGDLSYSLDTSKYSTQVPYDPTCATTAKLTCGELPDIKSELLTLKLTGSYQVAKNAKLALGYIYQKLNSSDYFYNGEQYGYTPNRVMPTNLQAPNYSVNVVSASYIYNF